MKLSEWWGRSMVNFALLPVKPVLLTWSILYWAWREGSNAAVILKLYNNTSSFSRLTERVR